LKCTRNSFPEGETPATRSRRRGLTLREGVRRADGSLDRAGFLGGAADMIKSAARIQAPLLTEARAKGRAGFGRTQLMRAALEDNEQLLCELVAAGAKLGCVGSGKMALHFASHGGCANVAKLLLDGKYEGKGVDANLTDGGGDRPLLWASFDGREAVVRLLLERGADVTLRGSGGHTALFYARSQQHAAIVALLEAHGARE